MAGIVLVTKPSFLFPDNINVVSNETWIRTSNSSDLRNMYQNGNFFIFEFRSKYLILIMYAFINFKTKTQPQPHNKLFFNQSALIPHDQDPDNYYFIGALLALSCAIFTSGVIVISTKVIYLY